MSPAPDDERTVAPDPAFVVGSSLSAHTLPEGTRLREHEITGLIGEGGFGIVYLAYDHSLQRRVAIKEYMPSALASRANASAAVVLKSDRHLDTFRLGLKSFLNEARLLARFDHPSLVKVYRFWEENGTAYMVMPYYEGPTLKRALAELGRPPDEAELRRWLRPLLDALAVMHAAHCYHRDIAPDNILLTPSGPLLLDFGAARRVISDMTHALTVVLKPGFAPIEQYGEVATMAQGAWTDLYALASVVYAAVTGHAPMSSVERLMDDRLEPLGVLAAGRYSEPFLAAVDAALALRPRDRPQDVAEFRRLMDGRAPHVAAPPGFAATHSAPLEPVLAEEPTLPPRVRDSPPQKQPPAQPPAPLQPTLQPALQPALPPTPVPGPAVAAVPPAAQEALTAPAAPRRTAMLAIAAAAGVVALAALGYFSAKSHRAPADAAPAPIVSAPTAPALPASAAAAVPAPMPTPPAEPAPAPAPVPPAVAVEEATALSAEPAPVPGKPASPAPTKPRAPRAEPAARPIIERPAPHANPPVTPARCSDILQKASLEPLTPSEAAYLKRECR